MKLYIPSAKSGRSTLTYAKKFLVCSDGDKAEAKEIALSIFGPATNRGFSNSSVLEQINSYIDSIEVVRKPID